MNLSGYTLTFSDDFNTRSISQDGIGTKWSDIRPEWRYDANSDIGFGHSSFVDKASGYDPFDVSNGILSITAVSDRTPYGYPTSWESGLIHTRGEFAQTYGYFEMRADLSEVSGAWDAFWLLPVQPANDKTEGWQELDIVEHYGSYTPGVYSWIHTTDYDPDPNLNLQVFSNHPEQSTGFHSYGMEWNADTISFYFDGALMGTRKTPSDMHGPMYILANLATQSEVDAAGASPVMKIDYIRAYAKDADVEGVPGKSVKGTAASDVLKGGDGNDRLDGMGGADVLLGGKGADALVGGAGPDTASYANASAGVSTSLSAPAGNTGDAAGDTYSSIERLVGTKFADALQGDAKSNLLDGGAGVDRLAGGAGNDSYQVDNVGDVVVETAKGGWDTIFASASYELASGQEIEDLRAGGGAAGFALTGNEFGNSILGNDGNNVVHGGAGNDSLSGGAGNDRLFGDAGSDRLTGGAGADTFLFAEAPKRGSSDTITDFKAVDDTIALDRDVFTTAGAAGQLASAAFFASADGRAHDATDRLLYNQRSGDLFYDADGSGKGGSVLIAHLDNHPVLTASDFMLVA